MLEHVVTLFYQFPAMSSMSLHNADQLFSAMENAIGSTKRKMRNCVIIFRPINATIWVRYGVNGHQQPYEVSAQ